MDFLPGLLFHIRQHTEAGVGDGGERTIVIGTITTARARLPRDSAVLVLDTSILVAATLSPFGASYQLLAMIPQRHFDLLLSVPLMLEYEEVLKRDDMRAQSHLTVEEVDGLLDMLARPSAPHTPPLSSGAPNCPIPTMK